MCVTTKTRHLNRLGQLSELEKESNTKSQQESNTDSHVSLHVCGYIGTPDNPTFSGAVHGQTFGHCSGAVCQPFAVLPGYKAAT